MRIPQAFIYGSILLGLDLWTKNWAHQHLQHRDVELIPRFFKLSLVHNRGIAFGLFDDPVAVSPIKSLVLISVALAALLVVSTYAFRTPPRARAAHLALGFLLGGILGNMIDRIAHFYVIDFLDFNLYFFKFPTFNLADTGITVGVVLLLLLEALHEGGNWEGYPPPNAGVPGETERWS
ncbi:MAG: signal peptidase II [Acidobacteria bacterium]|nr:signal peptidase II [Acidobacteriota bacterium]